MKPQNSQGQFILRPRPRELHFSPAPAHVSRARARILMTRVTENSK